jgi:predicted GIY-YIG superfamily endonuclease
MVYTIYALVDPRTMVTFYVGCTKNPVNRLRQHRQTKHRPDSSKAIKAKVEEIQAQGFQPSMVTLEQTTDKTRERHWIEHCRFLGLPLLNVCLPYSPKRAKRTPSELRTINQVAAIQRGAKKRAASEARYEEYKRTQGR